MSKKRKGYCRYSAYRRIVARDGEKCRHCGETPIVWMDMGADMDCRHPYTPIERRVALDLDHVLPIVDGGRHEDSNYQLLCQPCHRRKTAEEFKARRAAA